MNIKSITTTPDGVDLEMFGTDERAGFPRGTATLRLHPATTVRPAWVEVCRHGGGSYAIDPADLASPSGQTALQIYNLLLAGLSLQGGGSSSQAATFLGTTTTTSGTSTIPAGAVSLLFRNTGGASGTIDGGGGTITLLPGASYTISPGWPYTAPEVEVDASATTIETHALTII